MVVVAAGRRRRGGFRAAAGAADARGVQQRATHAAAALVRRGGVASLPSAVRRRVHRLLARCLGIDGPALRPLVPAVSVLDGPRRRQPRPPQVRPKSVRAAFRARTRPQGKYFQLSHQIQDFGEYENSCNLDLLPSVGRFSYHCLPVCVMKNNAGFMLNLFNLRQPSSLSTHRYSPFACLVRRSVVNIVGV